MIARVLLIACLVVGCGGHKTKTKTAGDGKQKKADAHAMLGQARDAAKGGDLDEADKDYEQAYALDKQFDVLEERVDFLIHAGRSGKALEAAKAYYDGNATDAKGYKLYAEALLANNKASEALEISIRSSRSTTRIPRATRRRGARCSSSRRTRRASNSCARPSSSTVTPRRITRRSGSRSTSSARSTRPRSSFAPR